MQEILVAKKYATSLISICSNEELNKFYEICSTIGIACHTIRFNDIIEAPHISNKEKLNFLLSLLEIDKSNKKITNFLTLIVQNKRIRTLEFIAKELKSILDSKSNNYSGYLFVNEELDAKSINDLKLKLEKRLGIGLRIEQIVEKNFQGIKFNVLELGIEVSFSKNRFLQDLQEYVLQAI